VRLTRVDFTRGSAESTPIERSPPYSSRSVQPGNPRSSDVLAPGARDGTNTTRRALKITVVFITVAFACVGAWVFASARRDSQSLRDLRSEQLELTRKEQVLKSRIGAYEEEHVPQGQRGILLQFTALQILFPRQDDVLRPIWTWIQTDDDAPQREMPSTPELQAALMAHPLFSPLFLEVLKDAPEGENLEEWVHAVAQDRMMNLAVQARSAVRSMLEAIKVERRRNEVESAIARLGEKP
jgi:hypothetical protein